jgi:hypothetical protein
MTKALDAATKAPVAVTEVKTLNGQTLVGSGNLQTINDSTPSSTTTYSSTKIEADKITLAQLHAAALTF